MYCWKSGWGFQSSEGGYRHHLACPTHLGGLEEQSVVGEGWDSLLQLQRDPEQQLGAVTNLRHSQIPSFSLGQAEILHGSRESPPLPPACPTALLFLCSPQSLPWVMPYILLSLTLLQLPRFFRGRFLRVMLSWGGFSEGRFPREVFHNCSSACWKFSLHTIKVHTKTFSRNI